MASKAARRYSQALSEIAQDNNSFETWQRDLETLAALASDREVVNYFENPSVQDAQKMEAVDAVATGVQPEALNLLHMLIERRRLRLLPDIRDLFKESAMAARGVVPVDVTTADALDDAGVELVRERLKSIVGKDVELRLHTDANIIGGIVARIGDQVIDGSVIHQLRRLRASLNADAVGDRPREVTHEAPIEEIVVPPTVGVNAVDGSTAERSTLEKVRDTVADVTPGGEEQSGEPGLLGKVRDKVAEVASHTGEDTGEPGLLGKVRDKVADAGQTVLEKAHIKSDSDTQKDNVTKPGEE